MSLEEKEKTKEYEKLLRKSKHLWDLLSQEEIREIMAYSDEYKKFLSEVKTEREAVTWIVRKATEHGYVDLFDATKETQKLYFIFKNKVCALVNLGNKAIKDGFRIIASHIDAPRLDLKPNPLYEKTSLAFFKTHYYGGIKKYQWLSRPLSLHGRIVKSDGSYIDVSIGEKETDPVFTICDLLPHLSRKLQDNKKLSEVFEAERLNILIGGIPFPDTEAKERFKLNIIDFLHREYGIKEEDLISAELEVVPAGRARDVGFDRCLIGGYGQDDRVCSYAALKAILDVESPYQPAIVVFMDKEEIGSTGNTGAQSRFIEILFEKLLSFLEVPTDTLNINDLFMRSKAISADVTGGLDPDYEEVHEKRNAARIGYGVSIQKYTGSGGKYGTSDASAEFVGWLRRLFNANEVIWQASELGKVDQGGGGTIAKFLANYGMEVIDCGTPLLSMHAPFEIAHKGDLYMTYKAYRVFIEKDI